MTINQAGGQADPTNASPINFTVVFSESVTGFTGGDVTLSGTAGATTAAVTGSGTTYNVAVSGMTSDGTVIATSRRAARRDAAGNINTASTVDRQHGHLRHDAARRDDQPGQRPGRSDERSPINFTVVFSEPVTGFTSGDVTMSGTAGGDEVGRRHRQRHDLQRRGQRHDHGRHGHRVNRGR